MEIGEPTLLAKLPRAGTSEEGSRRFSQVYGVRDGKTKKRNEICAAIDGNSLNIFEAVNGRNLASWPVPPDASFVSQPYSERKHVDKAAFVRSCWCAVRRKGRTGIHYYEQTKSGGSNASRTTAYQLENPESQVIKIDPVNASERLIVIAQEEGSITCISPEDPATQRSHRLWQESYTKKLHAVQSRSLADARASILKGRPDISATITNDSIIISAIYTTGQNSSTATSRLIFGIWIVTTSFTTAHQSLVVPVITHELGSGSEALASFKSNGTELEIQNTASIETYDLTGPTLQRIHQRKLFTTDQTSNIELSHDVSLSFSSGKLLLYNAKFCSLLASTLISSAPLKRKRDGPGLTRLSFIAYFSQLKRVLAFNGSQLLAIDIHANDLAHDSMKTSSLLAGNLLRGMTTQISATQTTADAAYDYNRSKLSQELDDFIVSQDISGFQSRLKEAFSLKQWEDLKKLDSDRTNFIIAKLFNVRTSQQAGATQLGLKIFPLQLLTWCIKSGLLDEYKISRALGQSDPHVLTGALSDCLQHADKGLSLFDEYITSSPYIQPRVLAQGIRSLINRALRTSDNVTMQQVLADANTDGKGQITPQNLISAPISSREHGTPSTECLIRALRRFVSAGNTTVSNEIRTVFRQNEVLALIQFLRQQLFLGGYTRLAGVRNYPSPPPSLSNNEDESRGGESKITLDGIVTLLNGCIDSLGMVGILGSSEDQAFIERMIPELYSEIQSATSAVEDSTYLQGFLRETLRYAESVERQPFEVRSKVERINHMSSKKGKVVTLYTEGDTADMGSLPTALPFSLKAEEDLHKQKTRKGGQAQSRSVREMGMLKDRLKAPYAFERLVL